MSEATGHSYLQNHQISGEVVTLNIEQEEASILEAAKAAGVGRAAKTLVKDGPLRIIILGLNRGRPCKSTRRQDLSAFTCSLAK